MTKGNLLIVDDEPLILEALLDMLKDCADHIYVAPDGVEALNVVKNHIVHCIVCDINMPKMNGVEVIKKLRSEKNEVPLIFYTGHGNHQLMMEAVKYGAFDFLDKPSLDGIEDTVTRGLHEGSKRAEGKVEDLSEEGRFISEYQKLLQKLK